MLLLFLNRNKFEVQGKIIYLYKTKIGLKLMDYVAKKFNKTIKFFGSIGIWAGYLGFIVVTYSLLNLLWSILKKPDMVGVSPVLPGIPIAGTGMVFPLIIGWISLLVIIIVHEFSHGVVARAYKLKILSSGIAFFGPIMGAFVEPNEKEMVKQSRKVQNSVYAAGPFANILLTGITVLLLIFVLNPTIDKISSPKGIIIEPMVDYPVYNSGLTSKATITSINNVDIVENSSLFFNVTKNIKPGDQVTITTKDETYNFNAVSNPDNESLAYIGVYIKGIELSGNTPLLDILYKILRWFSELFFWISFISINIGLINLYPIYITDGARMLKIVLEDKMKDKKKALEYWVKANNLAILILVGIIFIQLGSFIIGIIGSLIS